MSKKNLYPTQRQKAVFSSESLEVKPYHMVASTTFMFFRYIVRAMILLYIIIGVLCAFELISYLFTTNPQTKRQITSLGTMGLFFGLASMMGLIHNQILLILGHGYGDKTAQLYVDSLSTVEDCIANISIVKSMCLFSAIMNVMCIWLVWGAWGTPFYKGMFGSQLSALQAVLEVFSQQILAYTYAGYPPYAIEFKSLYWMVSALFLIAFLISVLGLIHANISKSKISRKKEVLAHE